jgi:lipoic acid synthetase
LPLLTEQERPARESGGELRLDGAAPLASTTLVRPEWLKARAPGGDNYHELRTLVDSLGLHTVCQSAHCPNIGECWEQRTATFMIAGNVCTRRCGFCAVRKGAPLALDLGEAERVAEAAGHLNLSYAVVTSVNRDDRKDGGAELFARTIHAIRRRLPLCKVEVLIPDLQGSAEALQIVLDAQPDVLNHNIETVARLYREVRPGSRYERSLELLGRAAQAGACAKSGIMVGLGEEMEEVEQTLRDLRKAGVRLVTIGQYLRPSREHLPIHRYYTPAAFDGLGRAARAMGFQHVESGPLVRSSYHARRGAGF